jgi:hypothetical protein
LSIVHNISESNSIMDTSRRDKKINRQQQFQEQQKEDGQQRRMSNQVHKHRTIGLEKECTTPSRRKTTDNVSVASGSTSNMSYPLGTPPRSGTRVRSSRSVVSQNSRNRSQRSRSFTRADERGFSSSSRHDFHRDRSDRVYSADVPRRRSDIVDSQSTSLHSTQTQKRGHNQHTSRVVTSPSNYNRHGASSDYSSIGSFGNFASFDFRDTPPSVYKEKSESLTSVSNRSPSINARSDHEESTQELLTLHGKMSRKVVDGELFSEYCFFLPPFLCPANSIILTIFRKRYFFY